MMESRVSTAGRPHGRARRVPVTYPAIVTTSDGVEQEVTVVDVSARGFSIEGQEGLSPGQQVYLRVARGPNIAAEVRWTADKKAGGILFDVPTV